jgi:hypothetical protein
MGRASATSERERERERERESVKWDAAIWRRRQDTGGIYEEFCNSFNIFYFVGLNCFLVLTQSLKRMRRINWTT